MAAFPKTFERLVQTARNFVHRHSLKALQVRDHLVLSEEALHLLMAGGVGLMGGVIDVLFYLSIEGVQTLLVGHPGQTIVQVAREMPLVWRLLTPVLGGLAAGSVLFWGLRLAGQQRSTNLLEVVVAGDGRLPFRLGIIRAVSSLISIGTGASIGREGGEGMVDLLDKREHGSFEFALVDGLARCEPFAVVVAREGAQEFEGFGGEVGGHGGWY